MNFWRSVNGMVRVQLLSGDPLGALVAVNNVGITVYDGECLDDGITAEFSIRRQELKILQRLCYGKGYRLKILQRGGIYWQVGKLGKRPVLLAAVLFLCFLTMFLPTRVLFVRVEGNKTVPARLIIAECADNGIHFGASRREVRSEKVKNSLLEAVPQLQWVGVTTSGCVATVAVRERPATEISEKYDGFNCIVSKCDGEILSFTVTRGTALCTIGQNVTAGEVLVSGYADCGSFIRAVGAEGEVYARTNRELTAVMPTIWTADQEILTTEKKYALLIGKKRINFYKGSGISGTTCDKIYKENYITLPGGFQLPVAIITERWTYCRESAVEKDMQDLLSDFTADYLLDQMTAGTLESRIEQMEQIDGILYLQGNYVCTEMIGQMQSEEILKPYGNDN